MIVGDDLHLHVPRLFEELLQEHRSVAEGRRGLPLRPAYGLGELVLGGHGPHAASPAPGARLDEHRVADPSRLARETLFGVVVTVVAGEDRHAGPARELLGADLEPDGVHRLRRRTHPGRARLLYRPGEGRALRQETVAGVDRLCPDSVVRPRSCAPTSR